MGRAEVCVLVTGTRDSQGEQGEVGREKSAWLETWGEMVQGSGVI